MPNPTPTQVAITPLEAAPTRQGAPLIALRSLTNWNAPSPQPLHTHARGQQLRLLTALRRNRKLVLTIASMDLQVTHSLSKLRDPNRLTHHPTPPPALISWTSLTARQAGSTRTALARASLIPLLPLHPGIRVTKRASQTTREGLTSWTLLHTRLEHKNPRSQRRKSQTTQEA